VAYPSTYPPHPDPPAGPPELPQGVTRFPRWPAWYGPVGLIAALVVATTAYLIVKAAAVAAGANPDRDSHSLTLIATIVQDVILVGTAAGLASLKAKPRLWHFGLRRARFWPTLGWAALGLLSFYVFTAIYASIVTTHGKQHVTEELGANHGGFAVVAVAFAIVVIAPTCEEIFFRGFFYRALRTRLGIALAAVIDGAVFGLVHFGGSDTLPVLPLLAVLGVIFCLVYERTGTIFSTIGMHATINTISYAATVHHGAVAASVLGAGMLAACALVPRRLPSRVPATA
jgi:membrane protease YdiL (CAAX protease family)